MLLRLGRPVALPRASRCCLSFSSAAPSPPPAAGPSDDATATTHFGFRTIPSSKKKESVATVFDSVAPSYDVMNDVMSGGMHRLWKDHLIKMIGARGTMDYIYEELGRRSGGGGGSSGPEAADDSPEALRNLRYDHLDVAGGTGDVSFRLCDELRLRAVSRLISGTPVEPSSSVVVTPPFTVTVCDINPHMLAEGEKKALELYGSSAVAPRSALPNQSASNPLVPSSHAAPLRFSLGDAESLPHFPSDSFDVYTIAFGLRNVTHPSNAVAEAYRVLRPGGRFLCLEFSRPPNITFAKLYDLYSFNVIPRLGKAIAGDEESYKYLVESIRKFDDQEALKKRIEQQGFKGVKYTNFTGGVVAIHEGWKL